MPEYSITIHQITAQYRSISAVFSPQVQHGQSARFSQSIIRAKFGRKPSLDSKIVDYPLHLAASDLRKQKGYQKGEYQNKDMPVKYIDEYKQFQDYKRSHVVQAKEDAARQVLIRMPLCLVGARVCL
jgi:hypothetical protein